MLTSSEIKCALRESGLEVYRTDGDTVVLAERVRENLILEAGVRVGGSPLAVTFVTEAAKGQFSGDSEEALWERARALGSDAAARGYRELGTNVVDYEDPSDPSRMLDHRFQVSFSKEVGSLDEAMEEVRFVLSLTRQAG